MGGDVDSDLDASGDRRLFGDEIPTNDVLIACDLGIARLDLAMDRLGQMELADRRPARSVAIGDGTVIAGSEDGVLVDTGDGFEQSGPATEIAAVGVATDGKLCAATTAGQVYTRVEGGSWTSVGHVEGPNRFDGSLLGAESGVYRVGDDIEALGAQSVNDVSINGSLVAATDDGTVKRDDASGAWRTIHDHPSIAVSQQGEDLYIVTPDDVVRGTPGDWTPLAVPETPVDICIAETLVGSTDEGTLLMHPGTVEPTDGQRGWRTQAIGLRGVRELAKR